MIRSRTVNDPPNAATFALRGDRTLAIAAIVALAWSLTAAAAAQRATAGTHTTHFAGSPSRLTHPAGSATLPHARAYGLWTPGRSDTCPKSLHDRYAVRGPDGKLYPTWHPPRVRLRDGRTCTFGHEHGRDPRGSHLYRWLARELSRLGAPGGRRGIPFGVANEALDRFAQHTQGAPHRHEDHVGHKIEWQNDVPLEASIPGGRRKRTGVRCDFLAKIHQGTHSADAFGNNLHELVYAARCSDGTAIAATVLSAFGRANELIRSCDGRTVIAAGTSFAYPASNGARLIPDDVCVRRHLLVPAGAFSDFSRGLYEDWLSANYLRTRSGRLLAYFDPHFAVFNPARYADTAGGTRPPVLARTIDVCWFAALGHLRARGGACDEATDYGRRATPLPYDSARSPFDGAHRETYFNQTLVDNAGGPRHWWTDPFGRNASRRRFPGAIRQYLAPRSNRRWPTLESQAFGASRPYGGRGVHAPN